jgi:DNA-binding transcriptional regulator YiaG
MTSNLNRLLEAGMILAEVESGKRIKRPVMGAEVTAARAALNFSIDQFAEKFGFPVDALRGWEAGHETPDAAGTAYLRVILENPQRALRLVEIGQDPDQKS